MNPGIGRQRMKDMYPIRSFLKHKYVSKHNALRPSWGTHFSGLDDVSVPFMLSKSSKAFHHLVFVPLSIRKDSMDADFGTELCRLNLTSTGFPPAEVGGVSCFDLPFFQKIDQRIVISGCGMSMP